jgi:outer membrane murein-binding lipoprotein Lpp
MTSDDSSPPRGVVVPMWMIGIIGGGLLMAGGWASSTILDVRDQTAILTEKMRVIETDATRQTLPLAVARLEAKLDAMSSELAAVREDIRRVRPSLDVRSSDGRR